MKDEVQTDLKCYLGSSFEDYSTKWRGLIAGTSWFAGFNWSAFIFGVLWCVYRRLYALAAAEFVANLIISTVAAYIALVYLSISLSLADLIGLLAVFVVVRIPLGLVANNFLYRKTQRALDAAPVEDKTERCAYLEDTGKTNDALVWILFAIFLLLRIGTLVMQFPDLG